MRTASLPRGRSSPLTSKTLALGLLLPLSVLADSDLFYVEAQAIAGVTSRGRRMTYHSMMPHDLMQKNGVGFDWVHRFSNDGGDWGVFAAQGRLVWDDSEGEVEPQVYNLYFRGKTTFGDWWVGHDRIAFGLASYWDTHAELMGDLTMMGLGFERDWGTGYQYDTDWGTLSASATTGSGALFRERDGNFLAAARAAYGVLNDDNYTVGFSTMGGRALDVMGTKRMSRDLKDQVWVGLDGAWNDLFLEHKAELDVGCYESREAVAALYRLGVRLDDEDRFKLELQPAVTWMEKDFDWSGAVGFTWQITSAWSFRTTYRYRRFEDEHTVIGQFYCYWPM